MKKFNLKKFAADFLLICGMISALCTTIVQVKNTFFKEERITKNEAAVVDPTIEDTSDQQMTQSIQSTQIDTYDYTSIILVISLVGAGTGYIIRKKLAKEIKVQS